MGSSGMAWAARTLPRWLFKHALHSNPARMEEVNQEIEACGCHVREQYVLLGQ